MTVATSVNRAQFLGSGSAGPFTFNMRFFTNSEISVVRIDAEGAEAVLVEGVGYTLTGAGALNGGAVTLSSALAVDEVLMVVRTLDLVQATNIRNQGAFYPEIHETVFDRLVMMVQQVSEACARSFKAPLGQSGDTLSVVDYAQRAGKVLGWNSLGRMTAIASNFVTSSGLFSNPWADVRGYADINAAIAALGGTSIQLRVFGTHALSSNLTVPANIELKVMNGGLIDTTGFTLTVNGPFASPLTPVFTGTGTVTGLKKAHPEWWGGKADGVTDSTLAVQASIDGSVTTELSSGTYMISGVAVRSYVEIKGQGIGASILKLKANSVNHVVRLAANTAQLSFLHDFAINGNANNQYIALDGINYENTYDNPTMYAASTVGEWDARHQLRNLYVRFCSGHGVLVKGRGESQLSNVEVEGCNKNGFYFDAYDMWGYNLSAGESGLEGFYLGAGASNYKLAGCKSWMSGRLDTSKGDGFWLGTSRSTLTGCEAQDNAKFGFAVVGDENIITGTITEANGWWGAYRKADSAGFWLGGNGNIITATAGDRFAGADSRQHYAFKVSGGKRNVINIVAKYMGTAFAPYGDIYNTDMNTITGSHIKEDFTEESFNYVNNFGVLSEPGLNTSTAIRSLQSLGHTYGAGVRLDTDVNNAAVLLLTKRDAAGTDGTKKIWEFQIDQTTGKLSLYNTLNAPLKVTGKILTTLGFGSDNSVVGDVTATGKTRKMEVFDGSGNSLGYIQIYAGP